MVQHASDLTPDLLTRTQDMERIAHGRRQCHVTLKTEKMGEYAGGIPSGAPWHRGRCPAKRSKTCTFSASGPRAQQVDQTGNATSGIYPRKRHTRRNNYRLATKTSQGAILSIVIAQHQLAPAVAPR